MLQCFCVSCGAEPWSPIPVTWAPARSLCGTFLVRQVERDSPRSERSPGHLQDLCEARSWCGTKCSKWSLSPKPKGERDGATATPLCGAGLALPACKRITATCRDLLRCQLLRRIRTPVPVRGSIPPVVSTFERFNVQRANVFERRGWDSNLHTPCGYRSRPPSSSYGGEGGYPLSGA